MGKTILLSSHILTELAELCDRVAIMERGRLVIDGPLDVVLRRASQIRQLSIQVLNHAERAAAILASSPHVQTVLPGRSNNGSVWLEFDFTGNDDEAASLLEQLVTEKVRVALFHEKTTNLEEAFLQLTQGEVA